MLCVCMNAGVHAYTHNSTHIGFPMPFVCLMQRLFLFQIQGQVYFWGAAFCHSLCILYVNVICDLCKTGYVFYIFFVVTIFLVIYIFTSLRCMTHTLFTSRLYSKLINCCWNIFNHHCVHFQCLKRCNN